MDCPILWSVLHDAFGGNLRPPCRVSRLNYAYPSPKRLVVIGALFEIYHALKIGLRSIVEEALASQRFAENCRIPAEVVGECRATHDGMLPQPHHMLVIMPLSLTCLSYLTYIHSDIGALRGHPVRDRESVPPIHT